MQTHLSYDTFPGVNPANTSAKFIYVARNPKDVAVSYYYHTLGFELYQYDGNWDDYFERFITGEVTDGDWFDHVLGWWKHKGNVIYNNYYTLYKNYTKKVSYILAITITNAMNSKTTS